MCGFSSSSYWFGLRDWFPPHWNHLTRNTTDVNTLRGPALNVELSSANSANDLTYYYARMNHSPTYAIKTVYLSRYRNRRRYVQHPVPLHTSSTSGSPSVGCNPFVVTNSFSYTGAQVNLTCKLSHGGWVIGGFERVVRSRSGTLRSSGGSRRWPWRYPPRLGRRACKSGISSCLSVDSSGGRRSWG